MMTTSNSPLQDMCCARVSKPLIEIFCEDEMFMLKQTPA